MQSFFARRPLLSGIAIFAALAGCAESPTSPLAPAQPLDAYSVAVSSRTFTSCADVKGANSAAVDASYVITPASGPAAGRAFQVWCAGMAGASPAEYLSLAATGPGKNFSQGHHPNAGGRNNDAETRFTRLRLDPTTLRVNIGDVTFTSFTGTHAMSYASASACRSPSGKGNIDLTGTPFVVNSTFVISGYGQSGRVNGVTSSPAAVSGAQVVELEGGGNCGGVSVLQTGADFHSMFEPAGGFSLQLSLNASTDASAPVIEETVAGTEGDNDWYTSDVLVTWDVTSDTPVLSSTGCTPQSVLTDTDANGVDFACTALSPGGTTTNTVTVKRDATAPVIAFSGTGNYELGETVAVACTATDVTSGIASTTCSTPLASGPAYRFGSGTHSVTATATDHAGNVTTETASFTVRVTSGAICSLVEQWVNKPGVANSMCKQLEHRSIRAFINHIQAQSGKSVSAANAAALIALARSL